ncbi:MAG: peptidyl-prolyl cis-trans isomerase [Acidobacteriia bacterium]|nr:peptidyl-prolyl cis-trans isomerase [Terriglobia bacterium]
MLRIALSFALVFAGAAQAQSAAPAGGQKPPAAGPATAAGGPFQADPASAVPPTAPVITIHGVCKNAVKGSACTTVVTKAQFEKLMIAVNTGNQPLPPAMRRNLAQAYADLLAYAQAATRAGVENDPKFQEAMRLVRLQKLAEFYRRSLEEKNHDTTPAEIAAYYNKNQARYEEAVLNRIFLPRTNPASKDKDAWEKKAAQLAEEIREKAAKGGDPEKLQKDAYTTLELTSPPPPSAVGARRRGMLPAPEEEAVIALKPGEVTKVIAEPHAYVIYKLESRQTLPLDRVKDEISREIFRQKIEAKTKAVTGAVRSDLNDRYFAAPPPPANPPGPGPAKPPAAAPPAPAARPDSPK